MMYYGACLLLLQWMTPVSTFGLVNLGRLSSEALSTTLLNAVELSDDDSVSLSGSESGAESLSGLDQIAHQLSNHRRVLSRREAMAMSLATMLSFTLARDASVASDSIPLQASWSSIDGLTTDEKNIQFNFAAYKAMKDDASRTPLFKQAILKRLQSAQNGPESQVVIDLGTGPFALFAIMAAELGAGKVYAIEGDPYVAASARQTIKKEGWADIIEVIEGFSNEINLPEKADFIVAEIIGSIATEEGAYATIRDAHSRFIKQPDDPNSWIPTRIQTYAAPASYSLHTLFKPPEFDWARLKEPVRFNCRDPGLQLLADPVLVEDISFSKVLTKSQEDAIAAPKQLSFRVDENRIQKNKQPLYDEFRRGKSSPQDSEELAEAASHSLSGIAFWPRLILDGDEKIIVDSREYPNGEPRRSHWQTVLPIAAARPIPVVGGEKVDVTINFDISTSISKSSKYQLNGSVS